MSQNKSPWSPEQVKILSVEEFYLFYHTTGQNTLAIHELAYNQFCRIERLNDALMAVLAVPDKSHTPLRQKNWGFYVANQCLVFFDDSDTVQQFVQKIDLSVFSDNASPLLFLFHVLEQLFQNDTNFLQEYNAKLERLEEILLKTKIDDFDRMLFEIRKDLSLLCRYYQQLSDICETLQQKAAEIGEEHSSRLYQLLNGKAERSYAIVQMMLETSVQLRELHQTRIAMGQNQIIQTLTIVTTIFMPLSLIAAWYGMNFAYMPELSATYGYPVLCTICLIIVAGEFWFFKQKHWFS